DFEAKNGQAVVHKLKDGKITRGDLLKEVLASRKGTATKIAKQGDSTKIERVDLSNLLVNAEEQDKQPAPPAGTSDNELLRQAQQQRALAEQQTATVVDESIRRAKAMLNSDPDGAYDLLKRQRASVLDNPEIGDKVKGGLLARLDAQLRDVDTRGR